jgi:hypothetical protein
VPGNCDQKYRFEELREQFVREFQRTKQVAHALIDDLTVISGYAEIMVMRGGAEQTQSEFRKILDRAKKAMVMLQDFIMNLQEVGPRYS